METDRLAKILVPTLIVLALLAAIGQISALSVLAIFAAVAASTVWALGRGDAVIEKASEKAVDTTVAAAILDALQDPVVLLDGKRTVVACNRAAVDALGERLKDRDLSQSLRHPKALEAVAAVLGGAPSESIRITLPVPVPRTYDLHAASLPLQSKNSPSAIIVLHDVTPSVQAEQMRADFVANISHELRSPLSSLIGFIETLKGAAKDDAEARARFLGIMEEESLRMSRLISDLLSLSKIEAEEHIQPKGHVDIAGIARRALDVFAKRAEEDEKTIALTIDDGLAPITGDADELLEVLHNLIDNAIKYARPATQVVVSVARIGRIPEIGGPGIRVSVADRGDGITPELLPRLTERFFRVDKGRSRTKGGTGLGLAIVKHIVKRHRGHLQIDSAVGEGSTFSVYLPCDKG